MRELKFKGIPTYGKHFVYGNLIKFQYNENNRIEYLIKGQNHESGTHEYEVKEETIGQFTGLHDKNGKEIWEGDIVEIEGYGKGKVIFDEGMFQYKSLGEAFVVDEGVVCDSLYPIVNSEVEVIGNIYENCNLTKPL